MEATRTPTAILKAEHRVIEAVLDGLIAFAARAEASNVDHRRELARYAEFFRGFADRCHHGKEEELLFAELERQGLPSRGGPTAVMRSEHEAGRAQVRVLAELARGEGPLDADELSRLRAAAGEYASLLRNHIAKEDGILFPMADDLLDEGACAELAAAFDRFEAEQMGEGAHERLHELAAELSAGGRR